MIKTLSASESTVVNSLVSSAFGYKFPHTFFDDFPVWNLNNGKNASSYGIEVSGKLVSHAATRVVSIQVQSSEIKVGLIGAVATDPAFRAKGYSSQILRHACSVLEKQGCAWQFLWGSEHRFYGKLGFSLQGEQARTDLSSYFSSVGPNATPPAPLSAGMIKSGLTDTIFQFLKNRKYGVKVLESDRSWLFSHKTVKWFYLDNPFGFVGFERGMDMGHMVHEFGGSIDSVRALFSHIYGMDSSAQILGTKKELLDLGAQPEHLILEKLCLARPSQPNTIWNPDFWVSGISAC